MQAKNVAFSYNEKAFIEHLDVKITRGSITTIIGPNGSGKSTLLNLLANQVQPTSGEVYFDGKTINSMNARFLAQQVAIVFQQHTSPGDLTVERLVHYGRVPHKRFWELESQEDEEIVAWAIEVTKLTELKERSLTELSGGERQRAWIAMALAQQPQVLFLDEPTTYLDIYYQLEVLELVKELNETLGITIVMVLHEMNQAIQYSDEVVVMKKGSIHHRGKVKEVFSEQMIEEIYGIKTVMRWCEVNQCNYILPARLGGQTCGCKVHCPLQK